MATKKEKVENLLKQENVNEVIISPSSAQESEFGTNYEGIREGFFQFVDGDGDYWDCDEDEIDLIILDNGTEIDISEIKDDE